MQFLGKVLFPFLSTSNSHLSGYESEKSLKELGFSTDQAQWLDGLGYTFEAVKARLDEGFTAEEVVNAVTVKLLHDKVEIAAYRALQEGISVLKLRTLKGRTILSFAECRHLLHDYIKTAAHKVMRASDGYVTLRGQYLNEKQFRPVISRVKDIVTDRDLKLTNAAYSCLEDLVANLDAHNGFVNGILFNAWGVPSHPKDHLQEIKKLAGYIGAEKPLDDAEPKKKKVCSKVEQESIPEL